MCLESKPCYLVRSPRWLLDVSIQLRVGFQLNGLHNTGVLLNGVLLVRQGRKRNRELMMGG